MIQALLIASGGILFMLCVLTVLVANHRGAFGVLLGGFATLCAVVGGGVAVLLMLMGAAL